jgi:hypothetical protein
MMNIDDVVTKKIRSQLKMKQIIIVLMSNGRHNTAL